MATLLDRLACLLLGHLETVHYAIDHEGKLIHAGTYCTSCKKVTFPTGGK